MDELVRKKLEIFLQRLPERMEEADVDLVRRAAECARELHKGQMRASGEPYFVHPLEVAQILWDMQMDATTLAAAFLHDTLEDTSLDRNELKDRFGKDVEALVNGVTKIDIVKTKNKNAAEAETIRKMLFAMVKDIRVILIKLADRLHNMKTLQHKKPDRQRAIAQDTLDIYAPLAARLGISWMKDELEDLSLKFLHPEVYQQIKAYVAQKKGERAEYLERVALAIEEESRKEGISVQVHTRAKHFFSIYQKMKERGKTMDEIYDLLGIRVLCGQVQDCYILLGMVHRLWKPIDGRFKDYIAMPKSNLYQSLHTTVMCYDGKLTEIQIRTDDMDHTAEHGVAAHWIYKKQSYRQQVQHSDLVLISKLRDMGNSRLESQDFLEEIKQELLSDSIYVFTPQGDVLQLPAGSTAIDFAYHIHTEVGNHAVGAKADSVIIPLKAPLKNTQVIEIITSPHGRPHVDWLRHVQSGRTRHKIRAWLNHHDDSIYIDRNIVARKPSAPAVPRSRPARPVHDERPPAPADPAQSLPAGHKVGITVSGERNMMIHIANCCHPVLGDDIVGYTSRGRGIMVHRTDCPNLPHIPDLEERQVVVEWETLSPRVVRTVRIRAVESGTLFGDIDALSRRFKGHLVSGRLEDVSGGVEGVFSFDLPRNTDFHRILKELRKMKSIRTIEEDGVKGS